ncbi:MAG: hypothetical protein KJP09_09095 [Bacteroidia bacterium]|nr:hypothetical protein [Bacteroidia bacterium]MBT8310421.1 hypothetical protein [Bacteroidia bacterium]NND12191.1 hypothetical protein [Flavobacteriaceae bacterium]NNK28105.1 hypothetical protein [Flavobacteriaceae bacterium]NNL61096.1 hypothetical protein [Flavobacteriaceae bacterium]
MENKTSKYFKYAIGEIILVVIGILIALQINNWNENRKLNIKEGIYLKGLKADFEQSKVALTRVIKKTARVAKLVDTLGGMIKNHADALTIVQIDSLSAGSTGFTVFMPSEGVINDIIGSGKLDMITNEELRKKIASWEADLRMIREYETIGKQLSDDYNNHTSKYFDMINGKYLKNAFLDHKRLEFLNDHVMTNYMAMIFGNSMMLNELYKEKSIAIDSMILLIDNPKL